MSDLFLNYLGENLERLKKEGLYKAERIITSPQDSSITLSDNSNSINLCSNNYLGLSNHPRIIEKAKDTLDTYGFGMSSVRFICGTQEPHKKLEAELSSFLQTEDCIMYSSCFDANTGLFETLLDENDAVISDSLNHASIIDGIRLCKARRLRYKNNDMKDLEQKLIEAKDSRFRLIATDGVFSMDGLIANLVDICTLADKYDAMVMVDDSHAVGFIGENGRGTPELLDVKDRVDIITGTLGKALGGASGGYTASHHQIIDWLRQRSRPYLFSNSIAPIIANTSLYVLDLIKDSNELRKQLMNNARYFRTHMSEAGFTLLGDQHPITPILLKDETVTNKMADLLLAKGVFVIGFSYPVVPKGQARIRTQLNALHTQDQLDHAIEAFTKVGRQLGVIE